ncbi:response regulator transcription factor [Sphingomonas sp. SM33]|uniref:Response regulator transcription factor n=1 Tax=Sphingomonas telluris TaxID=2907998 RepID=A0ABS9VPS8_9SPHN|nr:response regulator transcription factor [Sphingomonas telluris]MCH8616519.1 response regulator transcription factor [Sphingomonas telluris]
MKSASVRGTRPAVPIVLADDHHSILAGLRALIESSGRFEIVGMAQDGRKALELVRELEPQIAVLDYSLPELNGRDLSAAIRRDCPGTEILMYTMHDRGDIISDALRAGVRGFVVKTDPDHHILAALDALAVRRPYFSPAVSDAVLDQCLESQPKQIAGGLTPREREVVQLMSEGLINKEIALRLGVAIKTVETHRSTAMRKLKMRTTPDVVRWAIRNSIVQA